MRIAAFYRFYLDQHQSPGNRRLHVIGTGLVVLLLGAAIVRRSAWPLLGLPLAGYGFAWIGHYCVERNRPATFTHPFYSLACDFRMFWDACRGRLPL